MTDAAGPVPAAIELRDVTKVYPGASAPAVTGLSFDVPTGELVVLVGPSGCGKTTTLRMLNRLEESTSGEIRILGEEVHSRPVHELRRQIGYVIQGIGLFPHLDIAENMATVPRLLGWSKQRREDRVDELADLVDLDRSLLTRYPSELSGGQQQRVGVARALAADPPVLLMDEPYSAVDPVVRQHLQDELIELHRRLGTTIVLVTHDIDEAIKVGDRIAMLEVGGRLAQYATPGELLGAPASEFVSSFLGGERSLRRLALVPVGELALDVDVERDAATLPALGPSSTAREALDLLLTSGCPAVGVRDDGALLGWVTLATLSARVRDGSVS
jgi:osmoprotectant transport system ATP-binding protein